MAKRRLSREARKRIVTAQKKRWAEWKAKRDGVPVHDEALPVGREAVIPSALFAPYGQHKEMVDHPAHYGGDVPHEVWKCLRAWSLEQDAMLWNTVKYVARSAKKGSMLEDLKKARWYLQNRIDQLEGK